MLCKVEGCRFSNKHRTENHQCGKCKRYSHGQRECGDFVKCENLSRTIDKDNYYKNRIIISDDKNSTSDSYFPYQATSYDQIRKGLDFNSYIELGSGMGCTVIYKKIANDRILYKVINDTDYFENNDKKIRKDFVGNRVEHNIVYNLDHINFA